MCFAHGPAEFASLKKARRNRWGKGLWIKNGKQFPILGTLGEKTRTALLKSIEGQFRKVEGKWKHGAGDRHPPTKAKKPGSAKKEKAGQNQSGF